MKIRRSWIAIASGWVALGSLAPAAEPKNLATLKEEIRSYVGSGEYDREIAAVAAQAGEWLETRAKAGGGKLAMVFDLDETLLSNWPEMDRESFGFAREAFNAWMESAQCPAIESVRALYQRARRLGVAVIYITGRPERFRAATQRNLQAVGCADYAEFVCRPDDSKETSAACKAAARAKLEAGGYTIIANIGDQESDLAGGHAEKTFKLPNPFYLSK